MSPTPCARYEKWLKRLIRRKAFTEDDLHNSDLRRCLTTLDLIGLGAGCTLGAGVYVICGEVARQTAGPAVILSFLVAGIASAFAGLCYAEFAARVPRAGSAYVYSYVTVGELMAFVIGWNILLEYVIAAASTARALSAYLDYLLGNKMQQAFQSLMHMTVPGLATYPDFFAGGLVFFLTCITALGVKESSFLNNIMTITNVVVIFLVIVFGISKSHLHNWSLYGDELPPTGAGKGGFAPFGLSGIMSGAATCFYAYIGFDFIASLGEEAQNSRRTIPLAMGVTVLGNGLAYVAVSAVVTLIVPYFTLDVQTPLPFVFNWVGWPGVSYLSSVGAVCALGSSLMGGLFPLGRVVYAMASDGLLFRCLATVSPRFRTPLIATMLTGSFSASLALLMDLSELIRMMSIGTLLAFALVAVSVLILRYESSEGGEGRQERGVWTEHRSSVPFTLRELVRPRHPFPTPLTSRIANISTVLMCMLMLVLCTYYKMVAPYVHSMRWTVAVVATLTTTILLCLLCIGCQPQNNSHLHFKVPCVPVIPALSCLVNVYLMFELDPITWIRFGVWLIIGFSIYVGYGFRHSSLNVSAEEEQTPLCVSFDSNYSAAASRSYMATGSCPLLNANGGNSKTKSNGGDSQGFKTSDSNTADTDKNNHYTDDMTHITSDENGIVHSISDANDIAQTTSDINDMAHNPSDENGTTHTTSDGNDMTYTPSDANGITHTTSDINGMVHSPSDENGTTHTACGGNVTTYTPSDVNGTVHNTHTECRVHTIANAHCRACTIANAECGAHIYANAGSRAHTVENPDDLAHTTTDDADDRAHVVDNATSSNAENGKLASDSDRHNTYLSSHSSTLK